MALKINRTYGELTYDNESCRWIMKNVEPHVAIKIKAIFTKIAITSSEYSFGDTLDNAFDLYWFMERYPMRLSSSNLAHLKVQCKKHIALQNELVSISLPEYKSSGVLILNPGEQARDYQLIGRDLFLKAKRMLIGDDTGLGKTAIAIFAALETVSRPAVVVMQTHMPDQWAAAIEKFTSLKVHIIRTGKVYSLPPADMYLVSYSKIAKWVDVLAGGTLKMVVFDEVQELRNNESDKYRAAIRISEKCDFSLGLSATPIYNYADEIFHIMDVIKPGCLGTKDGFCREWSSHGYNSGKKIRIKDPIALGSFLREQFLFLRRTRAEVGRELPLVNTIVHTVGYDTGAVKDAEQIAKQLARKTISATFVERGQAARELDIFLRQSTGIAKAKEVAEYVRILLENGEPIVLAGWHREVYSIWAEQLSDFNPVFYTGTESPRQKEEAKTSFIEGKTDLFIISLRSGVGLDGLQSRCSTVVFGELDWSPQVHHQVISRVDRDGRQIKDQEGNDLHVTAIYLVTDYGSDPTIIELNGVKASISKSIIDPLESVGVQYSDESRITTLAKQFLEKRSNLSVSESQGKLELS